MTSPTGANPVNGRADPACRRGFTLIELILVMAMLLIVLSLAAPSLARFFRGRGLDAEATRFLALTRFGQSRAVSEGMPMVLWIDQDQGRYGLQVEATYAEDDPQTVEFEVKENLQIEVSEPEMSTLAPALTQPGRLVSETGPLSRYVQSLRFTPDGFVNEAAPEWVAFRELQEDREEAVLWVARTRNRLGYEIQTNQPILLLR